MASTTIAPMARFHPYSTVAKTVGLKTKKVKEIVEAMMAVAAIELKLAGTFNIAGALNMKLKKKPACARKLVRLQGIRLFVCRAKPSRNVVRMAVTKKFKKEMETQDAYEQYCGIPAPQRYGFPSKEKRRKRGV